jgi:hypothetical protein
MNRVNPQKTTAGVFGTYMRSSSSSLRHTAPELQLYSSVQAVNRHQSHARLLRRIYLQKLTLSINQLSRSFSSGDAVPVERLMTKLLAGKPPFLLPLMLSPAPGPSQDRLRPPS